MKTQRLLFLNFAFIFLWLLSSVFFISSIKFFSFSIDSQLYNFFLFVHSNKMFNNELYAKIILEYPVIIYRLFVIKISVYSLLLIISVFIFRKLKMGYLKFLTFFLLLVLIWILDFINFANANFYSLLPETLFTSFRYYLFFNGGVFILLSILIYFFGVKNILQRIEMK